MTHFTMKPNSVRVEFFKPGGKWYMTEAHEMPDEAYENWDMWTTIGEVLNASRPDRPRGWWKQFTVVVLDPYNKNSHPIMIVAEEKA